LPFAFFPFSPFLPTADFFFLPQNVFDLKLLVPACLNQACAAATGLHTLPLQPGSYWGVNIAHFYLAINTLPSWSQNKSQTCAF
jgi:hypothetical protein